MIERDHPALSIVAQCRLLSISRSSFYHEPAGETERNLGLMRLIDQQFLDTPFYGVRQMTWHLQNEGHGVNQKRIRRLMRLMRLMPIYQKPNTSKPRKGHKTWPYLLAGCGWIVPAKSGAPISPTCRCGGFLYLVVIMDSASILTSGSSRSSGWSSSGFASSAAPGRRICRWRRRGCSFRAPRTANA